MSEFVKAVIETQPCISVTVDGDPDPQKRFASLRLEFSGDGCGNSAHTLLDLLLAEVEGK